MEKIKLNCHICGKEPTRQRRRKDAVCEDCRKIIYQKPRIEIKKIRRKGLTGRKALIEYSYGKDEKPSSLGVRFKKRKELDELLSNKRELIQFVKMGLKLRDKIENNE